MGISSEAAAPCPCGSLADGPVPDRCVADDEGSVVAGAGCHSRSLLLLARGSSGGSNAARRERRRTSACAASCAPKTSMVGSARKTLRGNTGDVDFKLVAGIGVVQ